MKIVVTGANGMLGTDVSFALAKKGHTVFRTDISGTGDGTVQYLDICDFDAVRIFINDIKPEMVIHLAAETDVDRCEVEKEHAYMANTAATENIVRICKEQDIALVYASTASVFDGEKETAYVESDIPNPKNVYAKTKFEGEEIVRKTLKRYFVVRAGWMIGGVEKDKKFIAKILKLLQTKNELNVVNDKFGSPTFTKDFANCLVRLIATDKYGTYHMANKGSCSRFDIAKKIIEYLDKKDVVICPVSSDMFPLAAPKPRSEVLENQQLEKIGMNIMRSWQNALKEYISEWQRQKRI